MSDSKDFRCINTIRTLAADVVFKANSGHPGAPMGCAPMAHVLFSKYMKFNPANPSWPNRDRFVLSNGHSCALQYVLLHLLGYKVTLDDLKTFRQLDSICPGHPENYMTDGIEVTTGPLGQGISNAVGLALAEAHMEAVFNKDDFKIIDNYTFSILGDGCLQEGVASEAASLAGHLKLGKLIALYDANNIQIDGSTDLSFTEDVLKRFEAYGWHTLSVKDGDNDIAAIAKAIEEAKKVTDKPTIIKIHTTIGYGSLLEGTEKVHGAPLKEDDIVKVKTKFGFDGSQKFHVPDDVYEFYGQIKSQGAKYENEWNETFKKYSEKYPDLAKEFKRRFAGELPAGLAEALPRYKPSDAPTATRKLSETLLNAIADKVPELVGGSADLTHSNLTRWKTAVDFQPKSTGLGDYSGRYIRFGVREHGMAAISNGIAAYGPLIPFASTFLNFISYAVGASRLSALSHLRVIYIMTHDSIGLGEDGPTHQPIETLATLRATPNTLVFRPADGNEVSGAYLSAFQNKTRPSVIALTRQNLPHLEGSSIENVLKGGYVLQGSDKPQIILVATGSEVSIIVDAAKELEKKGVSTRVVSMPSMELFEEQEQSYKESVFPEGIPVLSVEAMSTFGWSRYAHASVGMKGFGSSAPYEQLYERFGFTAANVAEKAQKTLTYYKNKPVPHLIAKIF
ncbi:transketolase [Basidiobolus meristosporus CBS 931.73]|uniref:Transketolase n=1 Tax=Basidiobolus meristosporus CBS 931.73 TaxID=1314790 RepID=A0A1Y1YM21_9FUNG|nr:transketolase [Basidiobolus meristosporus CBS 931.73]|eukprot:ORX99045.1 transketolase [Basidiobolus meristosporus CBS 931.73]